jgi:hypothetical protein
MKRNLSSSSKNPRTATAVNDPVPWIERYATASKEDRWVGCFFDDREVSFDGPTKQKWKLQSKICPERWQLEISSPPTSSAIYECTQTTGENPGTKAVMKIHMQ